MCLKRNRNLQKQWETIDPSDLKAGCDLLALVCAGSDLNSLKCCSEVQLQVLVEISP